MLYYLLTLSTLGLLTLPYLLIYIPTYNLSILPYLAIFFWFNHAMNKV